MIAIFKDVKIFGGDPHLIWQDQPRWVYQWEWDQRSYFRFSSFNKIFGSYSSFAREPLFGVLYSLNRGDLNRYDIKWFQRDAFGLPVRQAFPTIEQQSRWKRFYHDDEKAVSGESYVDLHVSEASDVVTTSPSFLIPHALISAKEKVLISLPLQFKPWTMDNAVCLRIR
jgi:hypothetical protein